MRNLLRGEAGTGAPLQNNRATGYIAMAISTEPLRGDGKGGHLEVVTAAFNTYVHKRIPRSEKHF